MTLARLAAGTQSISMRASECIQGTAMSASHKMADGGGKHGNTMTTITILYMFGRSKVDATPGSGDSHQIVCGELHVKDATGTRQVDLHRVGEASWASTLSLV